MVVATEVIENSISAQAGTANTGGGGGGGGHSGVYDGGLGGSGLVCMTSEYQAISTSGNPTTSTYSSGGTTYYRYLFTGSGSITF